jgi:HAD superfamily hydrolase (TIGR01509 family)
VIRGALFDMDGLLLDTERLGMGIFAGIAQPLGLAAPEAHHLFRRCVGGGEAATIAVIEEVVHGADGAAALAAWHHAMDAAIEENLPLRPTVADALGRLAARDVPMAVVTSTRTARARAHLERAGLLGRFRAVIGGDRVAAPKPDPAPYRAGAEALGLPPAACAAFEDSDTGTRAALAAGCRVWQIPDLRPPDTPVPQLGQHVAATLAEAVEAAGLHRGAPHLGQRGAR